MNKKVIKSLIYLIFPLLFNVLFFLIAGAKHPASVWLSYVWIHVAYVFVIVAPLLVRKTRSVAIFKFTLEQIAITYFVVELLIGVLCIFLRLRSVTWPIVLQIVPFCAFLLVFLWTLLANERTADSEQRRAVEIAFIKTAASKAKLLMDRETDTAMKNELEKIYDLIHSSPSKSYSNVKELEGIVMVQLGELSDLLMDGKYEEAKKLIRKIQFTMDERNRIVALSN